MNTSKKVLPALSIVFSLISVLFCFLSFSGRVDFDAVVVIPMGLTTIVLMLAVFIISIIGLYQSKDSSFCFLTCQITLLLSVLYFLAVAFFIFCVTILAS
jgi:hypothetical protein